VNGDPSWTELRSDSGCGGYAASSPISLVKGIPPSRIGNPRGIFVFAFAAQRSLAPANPPECRRIKPAEVRIESAQLRSAIFAGSHPASDMLEELCEVFSGPQSFFRPGTPRLTAFTDSHIKDMRPQRHDGRERGTRQCR